MSKVFAFIATCLVVVLMLTWANPYATLMFGDAKFSEIDEDESTPIESVEATPVLEGSHEHPHPEGYTHGGDDDDEKSGLSNFISSLFGGDTKISGRVSSNSKNNNNNYETHDALKYNPDLTYAQIHSQPIRHVVKTDKDIFKGFFDYNGNKASVIVRRPRVEGTPLLFREKREGESGYDYIASAIDEAKKKGTTRLFIPKGVYELKHPTGSGAYYSFRPTKAWACEDFVIDGGGSTFKLEDENTLLNIVDCKRFQVRNFVIDYNNRIATRGTIKKDSSGDYFIQIHPDYVKSVRENPAYQRATTVYEFTKRSSSNSWKHYSTARWFGESHDSNALDYDRTKNRYYLRPGSKTDLSVFPIGQEVMVKHFEYDATAIRASGGEDILITGNTGYTIPGMFFRSLGVKRGVLIDSNTITVRPNDPLSFISAAADGFNIGSTGGDIIVTNNKVSHNGDDPLNIHGRMYEIIDISGKTIKIKSQWTEGAVPFLDNERLVFLDEFLGYKKHTRVTKSISYNKDTRVYTVTVSFIPKGVKVGDLVHRVDRSSRRFFVAKNTFFHHWARGMLIQGSTGIVKDNVLYGSASTGIWLTTDYSHFKAAGPVVNVIVRNNVIRNAGTSEFMSLKRESTNFAPLTVSTLIEPKNGYHSPHSVHRKIKIINNKIENAPYSAIQVSSARDVTIFGNKIINANSISKNHAAKLQTGLTAKRTPKGSIYISDSDSVTALHNAVSGASREGVAAHASVSTCEGC